MVLALWMERLPADTYDDDSHNKVAGAVLVLLNEILVCSRLLSQWRRASSAQGTTVCNCGHRIRARYRYYQPISTVESPLSPKRLKT